MVSAVHEGASLRAVARSFKVSLSTVQLWVTRAGSTRLDRVDWGDRPSVPHRLQRTDAGLEDLVLSLRAELHQSVLGEYGAAAIHRELLGRDHAGPIPTIRTIGRILERRGALDGRRRIRRLAPPPGWYLPTVRTRQAELDSFDVIEGHRLKGGLALEIFTAISLHGGLPAAWPEIGLTARTALTLMNEHWKALGLPAYAQFDNDVRFHGPHAHPDTIGPIIRLCLALEVVPVFTPPREHGFQASIEAFNGRWQRKVWTRYWVEELADLRAYSDAYIRASRSRGAARIEAAPPRTPYPAELSEAVLRPIGRIVYLRRTSESGSVVVLGRSHLVDRHWPHRLVRSELDLAAGTLRFYGLRRRDPDDQPLLREVDYDLPTRWFK